MIDTQRLIRYAAGYGVTVSPEAAEKYAGYARLLVEWNQKMNLTAITDPEGMLVKHFLDSLTAAPLLPDGPCRLIDVGTGAGFPGVPLAILRPDIELTLLDSLQKRLIFLETLCHELGLPVTLVHARAEEGGRQAALRERFDVAAARAVASLPVLAEYCLPFVKPGGRFIALKGPDADKELEAAQKAVALLGGRTHSAETVTLPNDPAFTGERGQRRLVLIDKIAPTPQKYPRPSAKIAKQPL